MVTVYIPIGFDRVHLPPFPFNTRPIAFRLNCHSKVLCWTPHTRMMLSEGETQIGMKGERDGGRERINATTRVNRIKSGNAESEPERRRVERLVGL